MGKKPLSSPGISFQNKRGRSSQFLKENPLETRLEKEHKNQFRYDGETFIKEVRANYILREQHGRTGYKYSTTMKQVHQYDIASVRGVRKERSKEWIEGRETPNSLARAPEISWLAPTLSNLHLADYIMYITESTAWQRIKWKT